MVTLVIGTFIIHITYGFVLKRIDRKINDNFMEMKCRRPIKNARI